MDKLQKNFDLSEIKRRFDLVGFAVSEFGGTARRHGNRIDIVGAKLGGLAIFPNENRWWNFSEACGGDAFDFCGYRKFGSSWFADKLRNDENFKTLFSKVLVDASLYAGVEPRYVEPSKKKSVADYVEQWTETQRAASALPNETVEDFNRTWNTPETVGVASAMERATFTDFEPSLIQRGTIFERIYDIYSRNETPQQFSFAGTLATLTAVIGDRLKIEFADQTLRCNDFFVLLASSGGGKSTAISPVQNLLTKLEKRIEHNGEPNIFLFPNTSTERGLLDLLRDSSDAEREKGITRKPQNSGIVLNDEITGLFGEFAATYNTKFDSTILRLWDGGAQSFATSARLDGRIHIPESALSILGASTSGKFRAKLPATAFSDGLLARMVFIHGRARIRARKSIGRLATSHSVASMETDLVVEELLRFFQFVTSHREIEITPDAVIADEKNVERWFTEQQTVCDNETVDSFYNRIAARQWKYAMVLSAARAFETKSKIIIDADIIQHAASICDFFKSNFVYFVSKNGRKDETGLDAVGKASLKIYSLLTDKFGGMAKRRDLKKYSNIGKDVFDKALAELVEDERVKIEKRKNRNGVEFEIVTALTALTALQTENAEITETKTSPKPESEKNSAVKNSAVTPSAVTAKIVSPPRLSETEQTEFDAIAKPALVRLAEIAKRVDADLTPVQTIPETDEAIEAAMESLPTADAETARLISNESEAAPVLNDNDFQDLLLASLPQKFSWHELRAVAAAKFGLSKEQADALGLDLWKRRGQILRLHTTNDFIKSGDRPTGYQGLVAHDFVLPCSEGAPF